MLAILFSALLFGQLPDDRTPYDKNPGDAIFAQTCEDGRLWIWMAGEGPRKGNYARSRIYLSGRVAVPVPSTIENRVVIRFPQQIQITKVTATTRFTANFPMGVEVKESSVELDGSLRADEGVVVIGHIDSTGLMVPAAVPINGSGFMVPFEATEWIAKENDDRRITIELSVEYLENGNPKVSRYGVKNWPGRSSEL